ncbi:hypothetical protein B0H13DRAFT_1877616 [Mycena leptocephala]|nr:hypothetical protein B0H13DRAFT_1877616 [Mycena leptocephala]
MRFLDVLKLLGERGDGLVLGRRLLRELLQGRRNRLEEKGTEGGGGLGLTNNGKMIDKSFLYRPQHLPKLHTDGLVALGLCLEPLENMFGGLTARNRPWDEIVQRECGKFQGPAVLEVDAPWAQVVAHGIPAEPLVDSLKFEQEDFWTALEATGNGQAEVKSARVLCREEDQGLRDRLSLRPNFSDVGAARRLLASGVFFFGTHCRVSRYRARQKPPSLL